jgi:multiple sugar transport system ATP-binding protein
MALVKLEHVYKRFGKLTTVNDFNLTTRDGEFVVLVGPSGCGKTTTLRMIAGLEEVSQGNVFIGERQVNDVPPKDRDIAMVFQSYALYPHMSVFENLAFALRLRKLPREEIEKKVGDAARMLQLEPYLQRKPRELSGGQRQRVALGRALVRNPQVFLMDEPLSNLDAKLRVEMRAEISKLHRRLGVTTIYVTHDQTEAMTMGERIVVMKDGNVQQIDSPLRLYEFPANRFVAGFIGSPAMSFIPVQPIREQGKVWIKGPGVWFAANARMNQVLGEWTGKEILLGVRPEYLTLSSQASEAGITGTVEVVEPLGATTEIHLRVGNQLVGARVESHPVVKIGDTLKFSVDSERVHAFDVETGNLVAHAREDLASAQA